MKNFNSEDYMYVLFFHTGIFAIISLVCSIPFYAIGYLLGLLLNFEVSFFSFFCLFFLIGFLFGKITVRSHNVLGYKTQRDWSVFRGWHS